MTDYIVKGISFDQDTVEVLDQILHDLHRGPRDRSHTIREIIKDWDASRRLIGANYLITPLIEKQLA